MKTQKLSNCCSLYSGGTPAKGKEYYWNGNIPWFSPKDIKSFDLTSSQDHISEIAVQDSATRIVENGTILVVSRSGILAHSFPVGIVRQASTFNQDIKAIVPSPDYDSEYIALYLRSKQFYILNEGVKRGPTVHSLLAGFIEKIEIPVISIEKQRQIAACLKAQLAEVDKARQAAEVQLREAQALNACVLKETFTNGASSNWPKIPLGNVGQVVAGITLGRKINGKSTRKIPYLRVANVKDGCLDLSDVYTIEATDSEIERLLLQTGDILLTEGGDPDKLGRGTFWSGELDECIHQNHIFRVRFPAEQYLPDFIAAQIGSAYGKDYFLAHAKKTTGIATINQKVLKQFPVLSPSLETQRIVMKKLHGKIAECTRIIESAQSQLNEINLLPQKILAQAFESVQS